MGLDHQIADLIQQMLEGSERALGRLITIVEKDSLAATEALKEIYYHTKGAYVVGITGAPGTGKSTLVDHIATEICQRGFNVGVIAIDPSSPFSGGALLGDRVRMINSAENNDIFVRSMGTRGSLGGLSQATSGAVKILDAFGKDFILIETSGTGQAEVDVVKETDTTVVVCTPNLGDEIQAMKAGIMEIGDIFVVNKADITATDDLVDQIETSLQLGHGNADWLPPVVKTIATEGRGIKTLVNSTLDHRNYLTESGHLKTKRAERIKQEIIEITKNIILQRLDSFDNGIEHISGNLLDEILIRKKDPYTAATDIMNHLMGNKYK